MSSLPSNPFLPPPIIGAEQDETIQPSAVLTQMQEFERLLSPSTQALPLNMAQAAVDHVLNRLTKDVILEDMARGNLPNALAIRYNVPIIKFRRWLEQNASAEELSEAMSLAAESMVVKSQAVLTHEPPSGPAGAMIRAFADRALDIAGKLKPTTWGTQKEQQGAGTAIQINITGNIPGLEALTPALMPQTRLPIAVDAPGA